MTDSIDQRRLSAILAADVVGYTHLMEQDTDGTVAAWKGARSDIIDPVIIHHSGRIVKHTGDGFLAEFKTVLDAVNCAVVIQNGLAESILDFRMGINLSDIIDDGEDIHGEGVNIAARIEALAEPGGICISSGVFDQIRNRIDQQFEDMGEFTVKHVERPVHIYRILLAGEATHAPKLRKRSWRTHAVAAIAILAISGSGLWWWQQQPDFERADKIKPSFAVPDKPSIAILPFINLSDDETQKYFADGMAEDIITGLSKISGLFVIARNSSFHYRGADQDLQMVGKNLGVRYVLEGSVRRVGQQVRINVQLVDTTTRGHLWAELYDGSMEDVFALQDRVRTKIVSALAVRLKRQETQALARQETDSPEAYDRFLNGWERYRKRTPQGIVEALAFFVKAIEIDPDYGRAYAALASAYWESWEKGWHQNLGLTRRATRKKAMQYLTLALERPTALAHQVASEIHRQNQRYEKAIGEAEASITLEPNNADGYVTLAGALIMVGRAHEAADLARKAMRRDPRYPAFYSFVLGVASYGEERYGDAAKHLARAAKSNPENPALLIPLAAAYGQLGHKTEAVDTIDRYVRLRGKTAPPNLEDIVNGWPFQFARDRERLSDGLRKAGLRDS